MQQPIQSPWVLTKIVTSSSWTLQSANEIISGDKIDIATETIALLQLERKLNRLLGEINWFYKLHKYRFSSHVFFCRHILDISTVLL
jgi:hypothetical protein